jgi:hypothetical protein
MKIRELFKGLLPMAVLALLVGCAAQKDIVPAV